MCNFTPRIFAMACLITMKLDAITTKKTAHFMNKGITHAETQQGKVIHLPFLMIVLIANSVVDNAFLSTYFM